MHISLLLLLLLVYASSLCDSISPSSVSLPGTGIFFLGDNMLSDHEQARVRFYLGVSNIFRYRHPRLEGLWGALDQDAEFIIRELLAQLAANDAKIFGTDGEIGFAGKVAGVKAVEEIQFQTGIATADQALCKIGRKLVGRLSAFLGVPIYADVYSGAGWPGDQYSLNGLGSGGGNTFGVG